MVVSGSGDDGVLEWVDVGEGGGVTLAVCGEGTVRSEAGKGGSGAVGGGVGVPVVARRRDGHDRSRARVLAP